MSQISRSPNLPLLAAKEIVDPSGEIAQPRAWSRSFVGAPPSTETSHILAVAELTSSHSSVDKYAPATIRVLSGNQPTTPHFALRFFICSGLGTVRDSPVAMTLRYIPLMSLYARY